MRTLIVIIAATVMLPGLSLSATIHIPGDQPTIQAGIDAANNGDTVLVEPGSYVENIKFNGKAITVMSEQGAAVTVIDGNSQLLSVARFQDSEGPDSVLKGFTLKNGSGIWIPNERRGGGIYCAKASPIIEDNIIELNSADSGGGIYCVNGSSPMIRGNIIRKNSVLLQGGGIYCSHSSSPLIIGNTLVSNTSQNGNAGGIFCYYNCQPVCVGCVFADNDAGGNNGGGFMAYTSCDATLTNCLFIGNTAVKRGGGIRIGGLSNAVITNCSFYGNHAGEAGGAIGSGSDTAGAINKITMLNCILWGNTALKGPEIALNGSHPAELTISYSDVAGGEAGAYVEPGFILNWGSGMIDDDPLFGDSANGDLHLTFPSPCMDTGDNSAVTALTDFEGDPRIAYGTVDMGADEFHTHLYFTGDATPGGSVELKFTELPGASPVGFWVAFNALDTPIPGAYGDWWLLPPMVGPIMLGSIPSNGVYVLPGAISASPPGPYTLYLQAIMGTPLKLTNLCTLYVE